MGNNIKPNNIEDFNDDQFNYLNFKDINIENQNKSQTKLNSQPASQKSNSKDNLKIPKNYNSKKTPLISQENNTSLRKESQIIQESVERDQDPPLNSNPIPNNTNVKQLPSNQTFPNQNTQLSTSQKNQSQTQNEVINLDDDEDESVTFTSNPILNTNLNINSQFNEHKNYDSNGM